MQFTKLDQKKMLMILNINYVQNGKVPVTELWIRFHSKRN